MDSGDKNPAIFNGGHRCHTDHKVKERDTGGKPPLIGTRNWVLPAPPPALGEGRWLFWVEINGYEPDFVPGP